MDVQDSPEQSLEALGDRNKVHSLLRGNKTQLQSQEKLGATTSGVWAFATPSLILLSESTAYQADYKKHDGYNDDYPTYTCNKVTHFC